MTGEKLLSEVKDYLDITWDDRATNNKLTGIIARGERKIASFAGKDHVDAEQETEEKALLYEYCRLAWAGVPEKFEELFRQELVGLRLAMKAKEATDGEQIQE